MRLGLKRNLHGRIPIVKNKAPGPTTLTPKKISENLTPPTSPSQPLVLPQRRIGSPQKAQGGNRNPNAPKTRSKPPEKALETNINTQSQATCPASQKQPQSKHNKEKAGIENVQSVNWQNEDEDRGAVTVTTRVLLAETLEPHSQTKVRRRMKRKHYQKQMQKEKCKVRAQSAIYREIAPRYPKHSAAPLLKRHAA